MKAAQFIANWARLSFGAIGLALTVGLAACGGGGSTNEGSTVGATKKALSAIVAPGVSVIAVTKVSETRVSRTVYEYVFKITVQNGNLAQMGVSANLTAVGTGTTILDGSVVAGDIAANAVATPSDTITLRHDRAFSFDQTALRWNVTSTASAGTLADARLINVGVGASADGNIYAIAGADLNNPVTLGIDGSSPGDQFNLLMSCGAPRLTVTNPDNTWRLIGKGTDMVTGLPINGCLRIVNLSAGKFIDIAIKVIPVAPTKTATVTIAPMGSASYMTSGGYLVEFAGNTSGVAIIANVFEAILPDGSLKLIVAFNTDVKNAGLTIRLPDTNAPAVARAALAARKSLAASSNTALATATNLVAYPNDNESLGSKWKPFVAWTDETAMRIPDQIFASSGVISNNVASRNVLSVDLLIAPTALSASSRLTVFLKEVSALYSVLPAQPQIRPADEEVVIFINGFNLEADIFPRTDPLTGVLISPVKIGGGKDTWGEFPRLAMESRLFGGKQLIPFEFRWATNTRFSDVADDLAQSINLIKGSLGAQRKIHLVAHSFGGLVVRTLLQGKSINSTATDTVSAVNSVTSVLTLGTPHSGIQKLSNSFLPGGQDSAGFLSTRVLNINMCEQASCHEAGITGAINDKQKAILYGNPIGPVFEYSPGWLPIKLAAVDAPLPNIDFYVGIGLRNDSVVGSAGDALISFEGQRFKPTSGTTGGLLAGSAPVFGAKVSEFFLGSPAQPPGGAFFPLAFFSPRGKGYAHQSNVAVGWPVVDGEESHPNKLSSLLGWGLEAKIEGQCGVGQESICEHGSLLLLQKLLGKPPIPEVTSVTPTTIAANIVLQALPAPTLPASRTPVVISGSNILSGSVVQIKRTGGDWLEEVGLNLAQIDYTVQQITYSFNPGTVADSVGIRVCRAGYAIVDADCSAPQTIIITTSPVAASAKLPDTGITANMCFQANSNLNYFVSCTSAAAVALNPSQDGMVGLDVTNPDNSDGKLGFSYTKIAANGNELPANATSWACVKDKVTGLMWENKTAANAPLTYTNWGDNRAGDASLFVAQSQGLCGFSNWRLPSLDELQGIVDYSVPYAGPSIDIGYFQYTQSNWYWSSSPDPGSRGNGAGIVYFSFGAVDYDQYRDGRGPVRLVRSGQ